MTLAACSKVVVVVVCVLLLLFFYRSHTGLFDFEYMCVRFFCLKYIQYIDCKMIFAGGVGELLAGGSTTVLLLVGATDCFTATYRLKKAIISSCV